MALAFEEQWHSALGSHGLGGLSPIPSFSPPEHWVRMHWLWENSLLRGEQRVQLQLTVQRGEGLLMALGEEFLEANKGHFVAISLATGLVKANAETLEALNKRLVSDRVREDCYVARIGSKGIAVIP